MKRVGDLLAAGLFALACFSAKAEDARNVRATLSVQPDGRFALVYRGQTVCEGTLPKGAELSETTTVVNARSGALEQKLTVRFPAATAFHGQARASAEAVLAETRGSAQARFPLVRTSIGTSRNLRNDALYDRSGDWMLEWPEGTVLEPERAENGETRVAFSAVSAQTFSIVFRPAFYRKHKGISFFEPWTYSIRKDSITGWCSWWAYQQNVNAARIAELLKVWQEKHFADYGYRFIQIDDGYQGGEDTGRPLSPHAAGKGGRPETWLKWKKDTFPEGLEGYARGIRAAGFAPGVWVASFFSDQRTADEHPGWFICGKNGKPFEAEWLAYAVDAMNPEAKKALIAPTYSGLRQAGLQYVKIDALRHYLYDNLNNNLEACAKHGLTPEEMFRAYLGTAREELGVDTFLLACWGVLPEAVGLADGCRIGGDGYTPFALQQYNSWNGIIWRNDPDHCDVLPNNRMIWNGGIHKVGNVEGVPGETVTRPAIASFAGAMLMLSDRSEVYANEANLVGLRRSSPVLFSVPGQLYDYDERKTALLAKEGRTRVLKGAGLSPLDGDCQDLCPWWLNEFSMPYENWVVLHHVNWVWRPHIVLPQTRVAFSDLGLEKNADYLVYEFWSGKFLGVCREAFTAAVLPEMRVASYAIRKAAGNRPQLASTNRHLSQGAAEIVRMEWDEKGRKLSGVSRVIVGDRYEIALYVPAPWKVQTAVFGGQTGKIAAEGNLVRASFLPTATQECAWTVAF